MKFIIYRITGPYLTSVDAPHPKAKVEELTYYDQRTFQSPKDYDKIHGQKESWLSKGSNHSKNNWGIVRTFQHKV